MGVCLWRWTDGRNIYRKLIDYLANNIITTAVRNVDWSPIRVNNIIGLTLSPVNTMFAYATRFTNSSRHSAREYTILVPAKILRN